MKTHLSLRIYGNKQCLAYPFFSSSYAIFQPQWEALALATSSENDFSYMRAVSNATELPISGEYDYIVIGGGTAGCPLAATLSQNYSVLVLERGSVPQAYPDVLRADRFESVLEQYDDGKTPAEPFTSEDGVDSVRGRILGGSSMINGAFYSRAEPEFYSKSGINWNLTLVEEAYKWVEETIVYRSALQAWQGAFVKASVEAGIVPENGFSLEHVVGTKLSGSTFDDFGRRHGAVELLNRGDLAGNLRVGVGATVERILFSSTRGSGLKAKGVIYRDSRGTPHRAFVRGKGEVILSAGTIGSPQLLLLSGVGPSAELSRLGIPVVQSQPNVGKFVADNTRNNVAILTPFSLPPSYIQAVAITRDFYIESLSTIIKFAPISKPSSLYQYLSSPINHSLVFLCVKVPGPASKGFLTLASRADPRVAPNVRFNYFSDPSDLEKCLKGMRKAGDLLDTETMARFKFDNRDVLGENGFKFFGLSLPVDYRMNNASLEKCCRSTISTWWHYHGGCVAGKVVDGDLRVTGFEGLRVVDASVFTSSPGTNPQATLMMMGRYVGLKIIQQRMT